MNTKLFFLIIVSVTLLGCLVHADGFANKSTNSIEVVGVYSMILQTNGDYIFADPSEFWRGVWKEDPNHWRVELNFEKTNTADFTLEVAIGVVDTNLLSIDKPHYFEAPDGKFEVFELQDANGVLIQPKPGKQLQRKFPKQISVGEYRRDRVGGIRNLFYLHTTDTPPTTVGRHKLNDVFSITNEGDFLLTVQPVLFKDTNDLNQHFPLWGPTMTVADSNTNFFERMDFPSVSAKIHLFPLHKN